MVGAGFHNRSRSAAARLRPSADRGAGGEVAEVFVYDTGGFLGGRGVFRLLVIQAGESVVRIVRTMRCGGAATLLSAEVMGSILHLE